MTANLANNIQRAKEQGFSDEEILDSLEKNLPNLGGRIKQAREQGFSLEEINQTLINRLSQQQPQQSIQETDGIFSNILNVAKATGRGLLEGIVDLGMIFGPTFPVTQQDVEGQENFFRQLREDIPVEEGFVAGAAERGARLFPSVAASPFPQSVLSTGTRSGLAGLAGQGVQELGGGEGLQTIAELAPLIAPSPSAIVRPTASQQKIVDTARKFNLSEQELAPLVQSDTKINNALVRFSRKAGRVERSVDKTKKVLTQNIQKLQDDPRAAKILSSNDRQILTEELRNVFKEIPDEARQKLIPDFVDLTNSEFSGKDLINFWRDINFQLGKGNNRVGIAKEPVLAAIQKIDESLASDFQGLNNLWSQFADVSAKLKPTSFEKILEGSRLIRAAGGLIFGYQSVLFEALGEIAGTRLLAEMTVNPRFKNLSLKLVDAINQNNPAIAKKVFDLIKNEAILAVPEAADKINLLSIDELFQKKK